MVLAHLQLAMAMVLWNTNHPIYLCDFAIARLLFEHHFAIEDLHNP